MDATSNQAQDRSEVIRFGGAGTVLLLSLLAFIGIYPLMLGGVASRLIGSLIFTTILVTGTMTASRSRLQRVISIALAISAIALQVAWLTTGNILLEAGLMVVFSIFCIYTALVILRHVLAFGPVYADRVHAALSVYILLALFWAGAYALIEVVLPGSFSFPTGAADKGAPLTGAPLLANMIHLSIATLTSTGYGDILPVAPLARSVSQLEQLTGVFYIAVLISRLVGLYPSDGDK